MIGFTLQELFELASPGGGRFSVHSADEAKEFCRKIAVSHYENFPVGSLLIDKKNREHFYSVYAFARIADDISDEFHDNAELRIDALDSMAELAEEAAANSSGSSNPLLLALRETMKSKGIPPEPMKKLLVAFKQDIYFKQPGCIADLDDYCMYSANPIGELVLRIFGEYNAETAPLSDKICTGLQLVNFWQDFSRDLPQGRLYIPVDIIEKYNIEPKDILVRKTGIARLDILLDELYSETGKYFVSGTPLLRSIRNARLRTELALTIRGGMHVLGRVKELGTSILFNRPKLKKINLVKLLILAVIDGFTFKNRTGSLRKS